MSTITLAPLNKTVTVGDSQEFTATVADAAEGATTTYVWTVDTVAQSSITNKMTYAASTAGTKAIKVVATIKVADTDDEVIEATTTLVVEEAVAPIDPEDVNYIHPLEHRDSAYLWLGWWVFREIEKATAEGIDWKIKYDELNYSKDLETLAYMLETYPNVEVQESRNGYILSKNTIESGYIY